MSTLLEGLNPEQQQAVTHVNGPLFIVAGAGTGKTTVITKRIAWLIEQGHAKPEQILALTFTDKAAGEMEERVDVLLPYGYVDLQISTFHAFCERLLRDHGVHIGLSPDFRILSELDVWLLMRQKFERFELEYYRPLGNPTKYLRTLLQHFSRAKDAAITSAQYVAFAEQKRLDRDIDKDDSHEDELARAYHTYQQILLENDGLDFGDLILYALQLLKDRPAILKRVQEQFPFVLVDEFQDTNHAQYELVRSIAGPRQNLTVVGDDDQAIYKFRGASIENILRFQHDFPQAKKIVLTQNYRSFQGILDHAYHFIQANNPNRLEVKAQLSKKLLAVRTGEGLIEHLHCSTVEEEVKTVILKIQTLKNEKTDATWSDFAILVRSNGAGADFAHALDRARVPYQFLALSGLYQKSVILDCLAFLRVIDQPHESVSLYRVLTMAVWKLDPLTIADLSRLSTQKGKSLYDTLDATRSTETQTLLEVLKTLRQQATTSPVTEIFLQALKESGFMEYLNRLSDQQKQESFGYLQSFFQRLKSFEARAEHKSLHAFLEEFQFERDAGEEGSLSIDLDAGPDMVRIMTVHAAKGLEFPYVFVVNLVDRKFPTQRRSESIPLPEGLQPTAVIDEASYHLEEERRLFYVAMTRAKDGLYFTSADHYGGSRRRKLSRFLDELGYETQTRKTDHVFELRDTDQHTVDDSTESWDHTPYLPKQFSFTQLAAFDTCPLQYKFAHILKVPVLGRWTFSFGKTMHNTLQRYFVTWMERTGKKQGDLFGEDRTEEGNPVSREELLEMYNSCWQDDWYPNDETREKYRAKGREQLLAYVNTFFEHHPEPMALEQGFTYKTGTVILKGRIDRLDRFEDGVEIIDYKTGTPKTLKSMDRSDKEQLWLYQLAVRDVLKLNPKKLTFIYLEDGSTVSFLGNEKELDLLQTTIVERAEAIRESSFPPTPGFHCKFCDFADICEFRQS